MDRSPIGAETSSGQVAELAGPSRVGGSVPAVKDRERQIFLLDGVSRIVIRRSSAHPVEYAITLITEHNGQDYAVRTFDNAHAPGEHHEHIYVGTEKQPPTIVRGDINDAMTRAETALLSHWQAYVDEWRQTIE